MVVLLAVFYLRQDFALFPGYPSNERRVVTYLQCDLTRIDASVLEAKKGERGALRLLLYMTEKPSFDVRDYLVSQGVSINLNSWVNDFLIADTTVDRLCFLANLPGVKGVALGE